MKTHLLFLLFLPFFVQAQEYRQYFDGNNTSPDNSIIINYSVDPNSIWEVGKPQKAIFDSAATLPNALVTDLVSPYPINDTSFFELGTTESKSFFYNAKVFALHWQQKLDYDTLYDGGKIEFSIDSGLTWHNAMNSPYQYNFYGFDSTNLDTLHNGEYVFTGTDSTWRNVWLCFDYDWIRQLEAFDFRFTSISDSIDNQKEGWMIDNMIMSSTIYHTLKVIPQEEAVAIYPNPASERLYIKLKDTKELQYIKKMQVISFAGKVLKEYQTIPSKFFIETADYLPGNYFLKIETNQKVETVKFSIKR